MEKKQRRIMPNVKLEPRVFGMRVHDFILYFLPVFLVFTLPPFFLITAYAKFNLVWWVVSVAVIGVAYILLLEIQYGERTIDVIKEFLIYQKEGDRLYENKNFDKEGAGTKKKVK